MVYYIFFLLVKVPFSKKGYLFPKGILFSLIYSRCVLGCDGAEWGVVVVVSFVPTSSTCEEGTVM